MERTYPLTHGLAQDSFDRIPESEATRTEQLRRVLFVAGKDATELGDPVSITVNANGKSHDTATITFKD